MANETWENPNDHAHAMGLNADAFLLLLAIQGLPEGARPTVAGIAERMCLKPKCC